MSPHGAADSRVPRHIGVTRRGQPSRSAPVGRRTLYISHDDWGSASAIPLAWALACPPHFTPVVRCPSLASLEYILCLDRRVQFASFIGGTDAVLRGGLGAPVSEVLLTDMMSVS